MNRPLPTYWPAHLLLGWLNLVLTAPSIYLYLGLPLVMRQHGWSGTAIGLFQLAGIPAILKFALAMPVDRWPLGRAGYRNWATVLLLGYAMPILALAAQDIHVLNHWGLFALALAASLMGTWADIPVNALAIQYLPESERIRSGAVRSAATSLGAIVGGGVMLVVQARAGWEWPFRILAGGLLSGICLLLVHPFAAARRAPDNLVAVSTRIGIKQWITYFSATEHRAWIPLLLLYFPFIGATWVYLKPLLLDQGMTAENVAWVAGVAGGLVGAVASMIGGYVTKRYGVRAALPACALLNLAAVVALAAAVAGHAPHSALVAATIAIAVAMGAAAGLLFGLMMYHTRPAMTALDYGIQSSLFASTRMVMPMLAGLLLDRLGYLGMLAGIVAGLLGVLVLTLRYLRAAPLGRPNVGSLG